MVREVGVRVEVRERAVHLELDLRFRNGRRVRNHTM
jgi:hypothetical protein